MCCVPGEEQPDVVVDRRALGAAVSSRPIAARPRVEDVVELGVERRQVATSRGSGARSLEVRERIAVGARTDQ